MVRLSTCFHEEFTCMLNTDLSTNATQPFFIYPREIPPEDSSPLLSFHPLLCMPAVMTMLLLHSHPTSTPVTTVHLDRRSGDWKHRVDVYMIVYCTIWAGLLDICTYLNLFSPDEQKVRETKQVWWTEKRSGVWKSFPTLVFIYRASAGL